MLCSAYTPSGSTCEERDQGVGNAHTQDFRLPYVAASHRAGAYHMWLWRVREWLLAGGGRLAGVGAEAKVAAG